MTALDYFSDAPSQKRPPAPRIVRCTLLAYAIFTVAWAILVVAFHHPTLEQVGALFTVSLAPVTGGVLGWNINRRPVPRWAVLTVLGVEIALAAGDIGGHNGLAFLQLIAPVTLTILVARDRTPDTWSAFRWPDLRLHRDASAGGTDRGAGIMEYAALIVIGALILGGITAIGIETKLTARTEAAVCHILEGGKPKTCGALDKVAAGTDDSGKDGGHKSKCSGFVGFFKCLGKGIGDFFKGFGEGFVGVFKGIGKTIAGMAKGIGKIFTDPIGFFKGIGYAITHPIDTLKNIFTGDAIENFKNGNIGEGIGDIIASAGSLVIPGAGEVGALGKLGKLGKTGKGGKDGKGDKSDPKSLADDAVKAADDAINAAKKGDLAGAEKAARQAADDLKKIKDQVRKDGCTIALAPIDVRPLPHLGRFGAPMGPSCSKEDRDRLRDAEDAKAAADGAAERIRTYKDFKSKIDDGRYEDADNLINDLRENAKKAQQRADDNPTPQNKLAAANAKKMANDANRTAINKKIEKADSSGDRNAQKEAEVAKWFRDDLVNFDKKYGRNGRDGEIDVETDKAIIEVTNGGRAGGKVNQLNRNKPGGSRSGTTNPEGKPTVLFAPNVAMGTVRQVEKNTGCKVFRDPEELKNYINNLP